MKKVKGYRGIFQKNKLFGLEFVDLLFLVLIYLIVFIFSKNLILNIAVLGTAYFLLRLYKKGKPDNWTGSLIRFLLTPKTYRPDREVKHE